MPPGGHSVGLAFEDAVLIARLIEHVKPNNIHELFPRFTELRAPRIDSLRRSRATLGRGQNSQLVVADDTRICVLDCDRLHRQACRQELWV